MTTREEYHKVKGKKTYGRDDCPLCAEKEKGADHILWTGNYWITLHNIFPYSGQENHLMAVPKSHKIYSYELTPEETRELSDVYKWIQEFYGDENYFSCSRETMANRSVEHFHMHFLPGRLQGKYIRNMLMNQGFPIVQYLDNQK